MAPTFLPGLLGLIALLASGCMSPSPTPQPFSPLNPNTAAYLAGKHWAIVQVTYQNGPLQFDAIKPVEIWFDPAGTLNFHSAKCSGGAFRIFFTDKHHYNVTNGEVAPVDCGKANNLLYAHLLEALQATIVYEMRGNQLFLSGPNVHVVLEIANVH